MLTIHQYPYLRENGSSVRGSTDLELSLQSFFILVDLSRVKTGGGHLLKTSVWNLVFILETFIIYQDYHHFTDENRLIVIQQ